MVCATQFMTDRPTLRVTEPLKPWLFNRAVILREFRCMTNPPVFDIISDGQFAFAGSWSDREIGPLNLVTFTSRF